MALLLLLGLQASGCSRLHPKAPADSVYVMAKQTFLRDRVAAVANRVAIVQNGDRLDVLERGRRFIRVKTAKGEIGWIEERAVVAPAIVTGFQALARQHASDPVVATAVVRDDLYMHLQPGRDTERFYLLPESMKLQLLVRASVPKAQPPQAKPPQAKPAHPAKTPQAENKELLPKDSHGKNPVVPDGKKPSAPPVAAQQQPVAEPPLMEDWWLTRDGQGRVGWLLARRLDVDVPDAIAGYAEGQRMVGAYVLQKVFDADSNLPDKQVPEYVSVLSPYKDGSPYDFDQVRVFTWNLRKHRYETAYRQRNLQGYLPVTVSVQTLDKQGPVPTFKFEQGIGDGIVTDPQTGAVKAAQTETELYRLDGVLIKKVVPPKPDAPKQVGGQAVGAPAVAAAPAQPAGRAHRGHKRHKAALKPRHRHRR